MTQLCGFTPPLPDGFTGVSPAGACDGVCGSDWSDGYCSAPWGAGASAVVYGCPGKTGGEPCDGDHHGGVLINTYTTGEFLAFSFFAGWPPFDAWCTFQIDILRPVPGDPIGLRDFVIWERDDCEPSSPPACHCEGTDYLGNSVVVEVCGEIVCGLDFGNYLCGEYGWEFLGGICPAQPSGGPWVGITASTFHSCALAEDGHVACWGSNTAGQAPAFVPVPYTQIDTNFLTTCGITPAGALQCWGQGNFGMAPAHMDGPYIQVSVGYEHTCAVRVDGTIECWGLVPSPIPPGTYTKVSSGERYVCGLRTDGEVVCWGDNLHAGSPPPGTFVDVAVGFSTGCGLRPNGELDCWGLHWFGNENGNVNYGGTFTELSLDYLNACALRNNGEPFCFGSVPWTVPGVFSEIASGASFHCAIDPGGAITCWGQNDHGQLEAPL